MGMGGEDMYVQKNWFGCCWLAGKFYLTDHVVGLSPPLFAFGLKI
jgi:hypothetical protein